MSSSYVPLESLVHVITKGTTPTKDQGYEEAGINFIRALSVDENGIIDKSTFLKISEETNHDLRRSTLEPGDVLFTIAGVIGRVAVVKEEHLPANLNQAVAIIRPKENKISSRYLANLLRSHDAQFYLKSRVVESVQANLSLTELRKFPIEELTLEQQKERNQILEQLEDYQVATTDTQMTLTSIISAQFRSWFIDFDPVQAKEEGKLPYGLDEETAALFPNSFEDSELGPIPKGWKIVTISDVCDFVSRGVTPEYEDGTGRWIINQKVNNGVNLKLENLKELSKSCLVPEDKFAKRFDVLVNCLGEGTLGRIHFFTGDSDCYAVDQHMSICRAKSPGTGLYIYHTLSSPTGQWRIDSIKTGSTGMTMFNISKLRAFKIYIPPQSILDVFWANVSDLIRQNQIIIETGKVLTHTRDELLPRLMSGELIVN